LTIKSRNLLSYLLEEASLTRMLFGNTNESAFLLIRIVKSLVLYVSAEFSYLTQEKDTSAVAVLHRSDHIVVAVRELIQLVPLLFGQQHRLKEITAQVLLVNFKASYSSWSSDPRYSSSTEGFTHPIVLNIYEATDGPSGVELGNKIASIAKDVFFPWSPNGDARVWIAPNFDFSSSNVYATKYLAYALEYSTRFVGSPPIGLSGPYDFIGVGLTSLTYTSQVGYPPSTGSDSDSSKKLTILSDMFFLL
jgi:hypothetical protein